MIALVIVFLTAIITLFVNMVNQKSLPRIVAVTGLLASMGGIVYEWSNPWVDKTGMFNFDSFALSFTGVAIIVTMLLISLSAFGFKQFGTHRGDLYGLMLFSLCGAIVLFSFNNLLMLFLGVEILSIPLYVLAGSRKHDPSSNEASLKYFIMGAFATGILLFGITLIYGSTGSFDVIRILLFSVNHFDNYSNLFGVGVTMLLIGMAFKIAAAPFHFWSPDVYEGSPDMVTGFMASVVKTAGIGAIYRMFTYYLGAAESVWLPSVMALSAASLIIGNFSALKQVSIKRMLAYSSVSHAGYLLLAIIGNSGVVSNGLMYYTLAYSLGTVALFVCMVQVTDKGKSYGFDAFNGLSKRNPLMAAVITISMLSLAGIPPLAGYFGKYFLFSAAIKNGHIWIVVVAALNSVISLGYYLRVIIAMYFNQPNEEGELKAEMSMAAKGLLVLMSISLIALTIFAGQLNFI